MRIIVVGLVLNLQKKLVEELIINFDIIKMVERYRPGVQFELALKQILHAVQVDACLVDRYLGHKERNRIFQEFKPVINLEKNGFRKIRNSED